MDRDVKTSRSSAATFDAVNPDLGALRKRGGKLILYHGWSDAALPPTATIDYYRSAVEKAGEKDADSGEVEFTRPLCP